MLYIMYCTVIVDSLCQVNCFISYTINTNWPQGASQSVQYNSPSILRPLIQIRGEKNREKKLQEEHQRWDSSPRTDRYSRDVVCTL